MENIVVQLTQRLAPLANENALGIFIFWLRSVKLILQRTIQRLQTIAVTMAVSLPVSGDKWSVNIQYTRRCPQDFMGRAA